MRFRPKLLPGYIISATVPYVFLALVLLTAVLFAQQAGRFAEIALYTQVPMALLGQVAVALLPGVLIFTIPIGVLAGIVIGYSRMGSDSEVVAMRSAGVGTWTMIWPVLLIGIVGSIAATYIHMEEAPRAARDIRKTAIQGALRKLDSPVDPRTFTTEIPGFVIYVRDGNKVSGSWNRVFIYSQQSNGTVGVVTARSGRIDSSADKSELVLSDAVRTQLPGQNEDNRSYTVERSDQLRVAIETGRPALLERLNKDEAEPEELDWADLQQLARSGNAVDRSDALRTLHRRIALSVAPFLFAILGGALGIRVKRGGRGAGVLLSLAVVVVYYLVSLLGESLGRIGTVPPAVGAWMGTIFIALLSFVLFTIHHLPTVSFSWPFKTKRTRRDVERASTQVDQTRSIGRFGFLSLLDISIFRTLTLSFMFGFAALVSIFIIFTLFELWRFIGANHVGLGLVARYLLFLLPLVSVEVFPATILIAVLLTYALLARRREAVAWWACGQSVYRLMVPGLIFAILAAVAIWLIQEKVMPRANVKQDALRAQIRGGQPRAITGTGRQWLASSEGQRLYSYEFDDQTNTLHDPVVYDFDAQGIHLLKITKGSSGFWTRDSLTLKDAEVLSFRGLEVDRTLVPSTELKGVESSVVFRPTIDKPSQLSSAGLKNYLFAAKRRGMEVSALALALQRKYATPFGAIVMAFIGIPLALSFGNKGAVIALCVAVGISVAYLGVGGGFEQLGNHGMLPPAVAAWSPPIIFAAAGTYFLSRLRT